jgi:hypothetical protein
MLLSLLPVALAVQGALATPLNREPTDTEVLEHISTTSPVAWENLVDSDGVSYQSLVVSIADWDEAVAALHSTSASKRSLVKRGIHCYGSGPWAKQASLRYNVGAACDAFNTLPVGQRQTVRYPNADGGTLDYTKFNRAGGNGRCGDSLNEIINVCHGENLDSRGGEISDQFDGNQYAADPN